RTTGTEQLPAAGRPRPAALLAHPLAHAPHEVGPGRDPCPREHVPDELAVVAPVLAHGSGSVDCGSAERRRATARCRRDFTLPSRTSRIRAISSCGRPLRA